MTSTTVAELVDRAQRLANQGRRTLLGVTGAPGAGKSTLCAALMAGLGARAALVEMDGFHLANEELARLGRAERKGAPDTFDVGGYSNLLDRLKRQDEPIVYAPVFDRAIEQAIGSAVPIHVDTPLVVTEGNYLLLEQGGWSGVAGHLDEVWFLDVEPDLRVERLVRRRLSFGHPLDEAEAWVLEVDQRNAAIVDATRERADQVFRLRAGPAPTAPPD